MEKTKKARKKLPLCRVVTLLSEDVLNQLEQEARRRTMSRSLLIRQACEQFLQQTQKEAA